jgi:hypothetical protein
METGQHIPEAATNWQPPDVGRVPTRPAPEMDATRERRGQSFSSRLCEYITGLKPEDPAIIGRLETDRNIIRAKYHLPPQELALSERERLLKKMAAENGVKLVGTHETGSFFEKNPSVDGVHFDDQRVAADIDRNDLEEYWKGVNILEHEIVHALQQKTSTKMPTELKEYEAYVAEANIDYLKAHPDAVDEVLFGFLVGGSVMSHYRLESEKRGQPVIPEWDNPEFFRKIDQARSE